MNLYYRCIKNLDKQSTLYGEESHVNLFDNISESLQIAHRVLNVIVSCLGFLALPILFINFSIFNNIKNGFQKNILFWYLSFL